MPLAAWLYDRHLRLLSLLVAGSAWPPSSGRTRTTSRSHRASTARPAVWDVPRHQAETIGAGSVRTALPLVNRTVPPDAELGVVISSNDPSYLLYGPRLERRLVRLPLRGATRAAAAQGIRWIAVSPQAGGLAAGPGWRAQTALGGWQLLSRRDAPVHRTALAPADRSASGRGYTGRWRSQAPPT